MAEGEQAATFEEFYRGCFDRLVGQLALVTGSLPEAEDLVQEAFLRAAARWPRLRLYGALSSGSGGSRCGWPSTSSGARAAVVLRWCGWARRRPRPTRLPWMRPCGPCRSVIGRSSSSTTCLGCR